MTDEPSEAADDKRPGLEPDDVSPDDVFPDDKDWTWVLDRRCDECGFVAAELGLGDLPAVIRDSVPTWRDALHREDARRRHRPGVWSVLEYACHARDAARIFGDRVDLMLTEDDPLFANWDQDRTAVEARYADQDPAAVAEELAVESERTAARFAGVDGDAWERTGRRSNGSVFTVATLGRYYAHDVVHHVWDVTGRRP